MDYKVVIVPMAAQEIADATAWYATESSLLAATWRDELFTHIATLEQSPHRARRFATEGQHSKRDVRYLLHGKGRGQYKILFEIIESTVRILSIRHTARHS